MEVNTPAIILNKRSRTDRYKKENINNKYDISMDSEHCHREEDNTNENHISEDNKMDYKKGGNNRGGPKKKLRTGQMRRLRRRAHKRDQKPEEAQPSEERGPNNEENTERENYSFIAKDGEQLNKKEDITNEINISEDKDYKRH